MLSNFPQCLKKKKLSLYIVYTILSVGYPVWGGEPIEIVPGGCLRFTPGKAKICRDVPFESLGILEQLAIALNEKGYDLFLLDPGKGVVKEGAKRTVFFNSLDEGAFVYRTKLNKEQCLLTVWEPPSVDETLHNPFFRSLFKKVVTWESNKRGKAGYVHFTHPVLKPMQKDLPSFKERALCAFMFANKSSSYKGELYSERMRAARFFDTKGESFGMYGRGWDGMGFARYLGAVDDKVKTLSNYRFSICYENTGDVPGYITEKLFDSFAAGCVPIYLGAPDVADYVPKECFIDKRDFATYDELYTFLEGMSETRYMEYVAAMKRFLESEAGTLFGMRRSVEALAEAIIE